MCQSKGASCTYLIFREIRKKKCRKCEFCVDVAISEENACSAAGMSLRWLIWNFISVTLIKYLWPIYHSRVSDKALFKVHTIRSILISEWTALKWRIAAFHFNDQVFQVDCWPAGPSYRNYHLYAHKMTTPDLFTEQLPQPWFLGVVKNTIIHRDDNELFHI